MEKQIHIKGINNRYQIKKVIEEKTIKIRKKSIEWKSEDLDWENQWNELKENNKLLINEIKNKLQSYKQQDSCKKRLIEELVSLEYILKLLKDSELICCYCKEKIFILYEKQREQKQWTLDRIDNSIGHNINNVIICCLECNLKRKNTNQQSFIFTKQLILNKLN